MGAHSADQVPVHAQPLGAVSDLAIYRAILAIRGEPSGYCRRLLLDLAPGQQSQLRELLASSEMLPVG